MTYIVAEVSGAITSGSTEALKTSDVLIILLTLASLLTLALTLLIIVYIYHRVREDVVVIEKGRMKIESIEQRLSGDDYISDQITAVLYDLYNLIAGLRAVVELGKAGKVVGNELNERIERDFASVEKHFTEIGLFSQDVDRRLSVQKSLANSIGDQKTLELMQKIADRKIGIYDEQIHKYIRQLKARLPFDATRWTGRPSGGAF